MTDIVFRESDHTYWEGTLPVPNVTRIIGGLEDFEGIPMSILEHASERGKAVHRATELHDQGILDEDSIDDEVRPYLEAWTAFLGHTGAVVLAIEKRVFCPKHRYAGMLDRIIHWPDLPPPTEAVLDIKCVAKLSPITRLQTAAYEYAARVDKRTRPRRRFAVQLRADGTYRAEEHKDRGDLSAYLAQLTIFNWRKSNDDNFNRSE